MSEFQLKDLRKWCRTFNLLALIFLVLVAFLHSGFVRNLSLALAMLCILGAWLISRKMRCPHCGKPVRPAGELCPHCGGRLED